VTGPAHAAPGPEIHRPELSGQSAEPARAPGALPPVAVPARPPEPVELRYLRETRNAVVFIAVLAGVICLASLIIGIVAAVQLSKVSSELGGSGGSSSSNCLSQGGSDPSC
jgi:hypothetical protein